MQTVTSAPKLVAKSEVNGIRKEVYHGPITLDSIGQSEFQKEDTLSAQIRQEILTKSFYPSKKVTNSMQDNIFSAEDFGFTSKDFDSKETRMAWLPVPKDATPEFVQGLLDKAYEAGARIYRVLSNKPILTEDQLYSINKGQRTLDQYADSQVVRFPKDTMKDGVDVSGKIIVDTNGNVKYRRTYFAKTAKADEDLSAGQTDSYKSVTILAELSGASVVNGQTIM